MAFTGFQEVKPSSNIDMMNAIRNAASPAYQMRIPVVDQANIKQTIRTMMDTPALRNEFVDTLVNRIGLVKVIAQSFQNPLAPFKKGFLQQGSTVEETAVGLITAYTYDHDREAMEKMLFGTSRVESQTSFHHVNRADVYKTTVNTMELERAFLDSQGGLDSYSSAILSAAATSDQWDEYLLMTSLFAEYDENDGFFNVQVPDLQTLESSEADAKRVLKALRSYAGKLKFMSRLYNAAALPMAAPADRLIIITTPEFRAAVDVDALAAAFNVQHAEMPARIVEVQYEDMKIDGVQCILTTEDFFMVYDKVLTTTQQWNPVTLSNNQFLHHHQVISVSRFIPAIKFSLAPTTGVNVVKYVPASVAAPVVSHTDADGKVTTVTEVRPGEVYSLAAAVTTTPAGGNLGVMWSLTGNTSTATYVSRTGVLHVGPTEDGASITVTARATDDESKAASTALTLTNEGVDLWPRDRDADAQTPAPKGP